MNGIKLKNIYEEIEYRLSRLENLIPLFQDKKVVVYGTGINAKRILNRLYVVNFLGLMDEKHTGRYFYDKKVLSYEEVLILDADIILIAAEPQSTKRVYERILPFCLQNHIQIIDMYGCDEIAMHKEILEQELVYSDLRISDVKEQILLNDAVVIPFKDTVCSQLIEEIELFDVIEKRIIDKGIELSNFKKNRVLARERVPYVGGYSLDDIYAVFSTLTLVSDEKVKEVKAIEQEVIVENLRPRECVLSLLKYAIDNGKEVYICSELLNSEYIIDSILSKYDIKGYKCIFGEHDYWEEHLAREIHALGDFYGFDRVLFLGTNRDHELIIPKLYDINVQLIEHSENLFFKYNRLNLTKKQILESEDKIQIKEEILSTYNSPFVSDIMVEKCDLNIARLIGVQVEMEGSYNVELLPEIDCEERKNIEKLEFKIVDNPLVSIVIPAYNQFGYTYNCLKSILINTENVPYEVIVADDNSNDYTKEIENFVTGIKVIHNENNLLFLKNCNNATKYAKGEYIIFLNNDTQVQLNWLYPLVKIMEDDSVGMVGSKFIYPDGLLQEAGGIIWSDSSGWLYGRGKNPNACEYNYVREVDYISGASIMIRKSLWDEIGGFDERFAPAYYEDADLAFEVRKHGKKVLYQPDSVVVHFEGVSNGKNVEKGIKKYQIDNMQKMREKWGELLLKEQCYPDTKILSAADRKCNRKTVLFVSEIVPTYDRDAGSRTVDFYIREFLYRGYIVKFIPNNFFAEQPYTHRLQQMGVQVLYGEHYKNNIRNWLYENSEQIDYVFLNYPNASMEFIDILLDLKIPIRYYGHDLHFLRNQREYELFGDEKKLELSKQFYEKEKYLIEKSEVVYYPSKIETEMVQKEFDKDSVKQLIAYIYDVQKMNRKYVAKDREGLLFIGGYRHTPNVDAVLWFVNNIFPKIYEKEKITFYIAGVHMPPEIQNINLPGVVVLGALTEQQLEDIYKKVKIVIAPLRYGAGIKGKILEAMYQGVPVVTTSVGAEGILNDDNVLNVADTEVDFAKNVLSLYKDDKRLVKCTEVYKNIIENNFSSNAAWNNICEDFK